MNLNEYQQGALKTAIYPGVGRNLCYPVLGLCGESGEIANKVKKIQRDHAGTMPELTKMQCFVELGDVLWYVAAIAHELGYTLDEVAEANLIKLGARQAAGTIKGDSREELAF